MLKLISTVPLVLVLAAGPLTGSPDPAPSPPQSKTEVQREFTFFPHTPGEPGNLWFDESLGLIGDFYEPYAFAGGDEKAAKVYELYAKNRGNFEEKREKQEDRIHLFRLWRIMEDVELTDEQVDRFFPLMRQLQNTERDLAKTRRELIDKLETELDKEQPAEIELKSLMEQIKNNYRQSSDARVNIMNQSEKILTVKQQAKLMLSLNRAERDIWDSIARVRHLGMPDMKLSREQIEKSMEGVRESLEKVKKELEAHGYSPDIDIDLGPRQPKEPENP